MDYVNGGTDIKAEYGLLATLCAEIADTNWLGSYDPREQTLIPNDRSLQHELKRRFGSRLTEFAIALIFRQLTNARMRTESKELEI